MTNTDLLIGPQRLSRANLEFLDVARLPGVYVLGRMEGPTFFVKYVGRADADLRSTLLRHAEARKYRFYIFDYFGTAKRAFDRECRIYHDFGGWWLLDNKRHPEAPAGTDWACPCCNKARRPRPSAEKARPGALLL